jgi:glutamate 5-kinase
VSLTVVKLGSTLVADDSGEVRRDVLREVCRQVGTIRADGQATALVTSGAIALGMREMGMAARPNAIEELQAASAVGQGPLYDVYAGLLGEHGVAAAQVLLTFFDISAREQYVNARRTLAKLRDWEVVPVINENDTTATDEISFGDNDILAAQVSILMSADLLVLLSDVDGLFTADPVTNSGASMVSEVHDQEELREYEIGMSSSHVGSGGMRSKVLCAEMATSAGIPVVICNGTQPGTLVRAVAGEPVGTRFYPQAKRQSSFKLWLRYAKSSRGSVVVDAGAERALREQGTSLLPVGVVDVRGEFGAGDAIDVLPAGDGEQPIGKGITNLSAHELRQVKGLKSAQVREVLPRASEEAVHRDYFVLAPGPR